MSGYRRGAVLGLTVAETFILLTFLLLIALLGLVQRDEPLADPDTEGASPVWVRPEEIETLKNAAKEARKAQREAEQARDTAEREREQATEAQEEAEKAWVAVEKARRAQEEAEKARMVAEREQAHEEAEQALAAVEHERDQAMRDLELLRRKGKNPPCWYQVVDTHGGKTREKAYYAFNVAIYEDGVELAPRTAPPGGAVDDNGRPYRSYTDEWKSLRIDELPYGRKLSEREFTEAVRHLVAQGRNRQVRTYECVFSVQVWDRTPDHAKKRWKDAHDRIIEGSFSAYTVQDLEWKGVEVMGRGETPQSE